MSASFVGAASAHIHVGTPPPGFKEWETHTVHVHGFESLTSVRGEFVASPELMLLGKQWCLELYPGGNEDADEGMTSLYLCNMSNEAIDAEYGFSIYHEVKQVANKQTATPRNFASVGDDDGISARGFTNFALRSDLLSATGYGAYGALVIEVRVRV
jgi:hypothetical protein